MAKEATFESFVAQQREALAQRREQAQQRLAEVQAEINGIDRELQAITAYELAKEGKLDLSPKGQRRPPSGPRKPRETGARQEILDLIKASENGLTPAEIKEKRGVKGDKSGEQSISNALSNLLKQNRVTRHDGRYRAA